MEDNFFDIDIAEFEQEILKTCTKCGKTFSLNIENFALDKNTKSGFKTWCRSCNKEYAALYRLKNKKKASRYGAEYRKKNPDKIKELNSRYYKNNSERLIFSQSEYFQKNKDKIRETRKANKRLVLKRRRVATEYQSKKANYLRTVRSIGFIDKIRKSQIDSNLAEVKCAYCGKWYHPTNGDVSSRLKSINSTSPSNTFYCSDECKISCPVFGKALYPKGFKKGTSREVTPFARQLCFERDEWTCQKCGVTDKSLHCHHVKSYIQNKILSNDIENMITLCVDCHKEMHKRKCCRYQELKCDNVPQNAKNSVVSIGDERVTV